MRAIAGAILILAAIQAWGFSVPFGGHFFGHDDWVLLGTVGGVIGLVLLLVGVCFLFVREKK